MTKRRRYIVEVDHPPGVTGAQMKVYIEDAVASMKGSYHPEDPIFDLDGDTVVVKFCQGQDRE
jgi:hypothetical protein